MSDGDGHRDRAEFDQVIEEPNVAEEQFKSSGKSTSGLDVRAPKNVQPESPRPQNHSDIQSDVVFRDRRLSHIVATFAYESATTATKLFEAEPISLQWIAALADDDS